MEKITSAKLNSIIKESIKKSVTEAISEIKKFNELQERTTENDNNPYSSQNNNDDDEIINEFEDNKGLENFRTDKLTPYTSQERKQNFQAIGRMGNPSYDRFIKWRNEGLKKGIPSAKLSWANYKKTLLNKE